MGLKSINYPAIDDLSQATIDRIELVAQEGGGPIEIAQALGVGLHRLIARQFTDENFDELIRRLQTTAAATLLKQLRENPDVLPPNVFDRQMQAVGFPHVDVVKVVDVRRNENLLVSNNAADNHVSGFDLVAFKERYELHGPTIVDAEVSTIEDLM